MIKDKIYIGNTLLQKDTKPVKGGFVLIDNEKYYKISNYDSMPPFLMNIVSDSDLWMFISSSGALTAGRKDPDHALFPYYTDDRIHDSKDITGGKTVVFVTIEDKTFLWEPFSSSYSRLYKTEKNLYKNVIANKIIFEEVNLDLSVSFLYAWFNCDRFGFIRKSKIVNNAVRLVAINILDGIQNILPYGAARKFQLEYSTLLDGYKKNELAEETGLGLYTLSSIPTDKAEPSEALKATTVWSTGLQDACILLSSSQIGLFRKGLKVTRESYTKAVRGAYLLQSNFKLNSGEFKEWYLAADLNIDHAGIAELSTMLKADKNLKNKIENEIAESTGRLKLKVAGADGIQLTNDSLITSRHFSNVLFNIMRGGIFENNYLVDKQDFKSFIQAANLQIRKKYSSFLDEFPEGINIDELISKVERKGDADFEKLCYEYLPLSFSRRHGDPSRPWNIFSIDIKDEHGSKILNYEGNWRDIFQNWEALAYSYPEYIESMVVKFVNAITADGYNPYKVTRDGFDWEVSDPNDAWSYIGYWGDHQVVYLLRLLQLSNRYHPGKLTEFLTKEIFAYANVPYKIKSYKEIIENPHNTIEFDFKLDKEIKESVRASGTDGKFIKDKDGQIYHVNLTEKLLVIILIKLSNFIPGAGIWMNTQRPEWNDANNALVGYGASMVTLYYLRSFVAFCIMLFEGTGKLQAGISSGVYELFVEVNRTLIQFKNLLTNGISDKDRKNIVDGLGEPGSSYRLRIYSEGFSGEKEFITADELITFFNLVLGCIDHSIKENKREDDLYHSYNLIKFNGGGISIRRLYEMLEGQVAVLSSGYLSVDDSLALIKALRKSKLYREDQSSYILYPDRQLALFTERNIIPGDLLSKSGLLLGMVQNDDKSIVNKDVKGNFHFNGRFRNASELKNALSELTSSQKPSADEAKLILDIYESVFDHQSFTGRSGTFYKYEGLGCIYWNMVSKLLLSVQEAFYNAFEKDEDINSLKKLKEFYYTIREGIGSHKPPELYGGFPIDPYSHTPGNMGAQQPGMTGQVKEDIISRFGELGVMIIDGKINFDPALLNENEFLNKSQVFQYYDVKGNYQTLMVNQGMLAFTFCQVPVAYIISNERRIILTKWDGSEEKIKGLVIGKVISKSIFKRTSEIIKINVLINFQNS